MEVAALTDAGAGQMSVLLLWSEGWERRSAVPGVSPFSTVRPFCARQCAPRSGALQRS